MSRVVVTLTENEPRFSFRFLTSRPVDESCLDEAPARVNDEDPPEEDRG